MRNGLAEVASISDDPSDSDVPSLSPVPRVPSPPSAFLILCTIVSNSSLGNCHRAAFLFAYCICLNCSFKANRFSLSATIRCCLSVSWAALWAASFLACFRFRNPVKYFLNK
eukprot:Blabericola_migrator_1__4829@NODE_2534_length_2636_cov_43_434021_g1585_i0_p3_GENE_NODE_2534_length_2636_cov_43_434021_g1585_i0NODE_2534_length_2636_cov_43_434021_g1585_i0_p3_ORF_typecomplete_len112_score4_56_NODE_2534_length_2636_cov_43_434021_g1585_i013651700